MGRIRILLAGLSPESREVFRQAVRGQHDMEVIDEIAGGVHLLMAAGRNCADVVVLGLEDGSLPGISSHLLSEYPHLKIFAVAADGRRALLNDLHPRVIPLEDTCPRRLVAVIRAAVLEEPDEGGA